MASTLWFTGLSGSGKTTFAQKTSLYFVSQKRQHQWLDGDLVRKELPFQVGFGKEERIQFNLWLAWISKRFNEQGMDCIVSTILPFESLRQEVRKIIPHYLEIYTNSSLVVCETRDSKGHYSKARAGELKEFTGISSPFEPPRDADFFLDTEKESIEDNWKQLLFFLQGKGF